jgi:hypothetical protein
MRRRRRNKALPNLILDPRILTLERRAIHEVYVLLSKAWKP